MLEREKIYGEVIGIFVGKVENLWRDKPPSAIAKRPVSGLQHIDQNGFIDDNQADLKVHGGPEKAIHHYASEHMQHWQDIFPDNASQFQPGCFGENISTTGLDENTLCLGDILTLGTAKVQVCQGRRPCWKLNEHMGLKTLAAHFQKSGRTGWYYRIIENGSVRVGDRMELIQRDYSEWPLQRFIKARFNPKLDKILAQELASLKPVSERWKEAFLKKSQRAAPQNTDARLKGN